ncbi:hypothetical protein ScPMuIL_016828 [Solemya velum]
MNHATTYRGSWANYDERRVCVPIDTTDVDNFDPQKVPTISQLLEELDNETSDAEGKKLKDYKRTSLNGSIQVFEKFLKKLENSWKGKLLEQSDMKREF